MNKLLFILLFLFSFNSNSQIDYNVETKLQVDTELNYLVEDFINEAKKRGFYVRGYVIDNVDFIGYYDYDESVSSNLGLTTREYRRIYINPKLKTQPTLLKLTFYHEMGHALNKTNLHFNTPNIMTRYSPDIIEKFEDELVWKRVLDDYFKWLNTYKIKHNK